MTPLSDSEAATVQRFENAEPAPESWGGGLREALADVIAEKATDLHWSRAVTAGYSIADAVLALPELVALRAKAGAADRVRALADELDAQARTIAEEADGVTIGEAQQFGMLGRILGMKSAAVRIRRALDGPPC